MSDAYSSALDFAIAQGLLRPLSPAELNSLLTVPRAEPHRPAFRSGGRVQPTEAQLAAGNYKKDHLTFQGLPISIETKKGQTRSGVAADGKPWSVKMTAAYGYIRRTEGADGDHVDCYIGPDAEAKRVWIIDQVDPKTRVFDEHKLFLGFRSRGHAELTYRAGFSDGKGGRRIGAVTEISIPELREWLKHGRTSKPYSEGHREAFKSGGSVTGPNPFDQFDPPNLSGAKGEDPWAQFETVSPAPQADPWAEFRIVSPAPPSPPQSDPWAEFREVSPLPDWMADAIPVEPEPAVGTDIAKSTGTGLARAATGLLGLPGTAAGWLSQGADWVAEKVTGEPIPEKFKRNPVAEAISSEGLNRAVDSATGLPITSYKPKTLAGEYARTIAEFAPGAVTPGGLVAKTVGGVLAPALLSETAGQAAKGTSWEGPARAAGALTGGIGAALVPRRAPPTAVLPVADEAAEAGVTLTAGQRTGDSALLSREDALLGGAYGERAQRVAQGARATQEAEVASARDALGAKLGRYGDEGLVDLDRASDAGGVVGQRLDELTGQAQSEIAARNAALQGERDALFRGAQAASESAGARFNPSGFQPVEMGETLVGNMRRAAEESRTGYRKAYADVFARDGEIAPEFFTGANRPGSQGFTTAGSPLNEFAAPLSTRVRESLLNRAEPIIPDATITPLAARTLDDLDRVAGLNLGRIGAPRAGDEIAGVNLRGIEQARKIVTSRISSAKANPHGAEDLRALRGIAQAFDDQLEKAFDSALFRGDEGALSAMKGAREAFSRHQAYFKQRARGDDAGATIQKMIERDATPEEVASYVLGSSRVGDSGLSVRLVDRFQNVFGRGSEPMQAIRGAAWQKLTSGLEAATPAGAQKLSQGIQEFATGRGSTLARRLFSSEELGAMQRYGRALDSFAKMAKTPVGKVEAEGALKTLMDVSAQRLSPENLTGALLGYGTRFTPAQHRLVDAVASLVGKDGPEWAALRQGQWQRLTGVAEGRSPMGAQKMTERLHEFLNGEGRSMAAKLYTPEELSEMRRFANIQRARAPRPGTTNPSGSGNRVAAVANKAAAAIATMLGASTGGWGGAALGYLGGKGLANIGDMRAASKARKLFSGQEPARFMTGFGSARSLGKHTASTVYGARAAGLDRE